MLGISHDAGYAPFLDEIVHDQTISDRVGLIEGPPLVHELTLNNLHVFSYSTIFRVEKLQAKDSSSPSLQSNTPVVGPNSWAGITSIATPPITPAPAVHRPVSNTSSTTRKGLWNPMPRGLDPPIEYNQATLDKVKNRPNKKLCNNHYLRGIKGCNKGDDCKYEHRYKCTEADLNVIRYLTRLNPCSNRQYCEFFL
jgi:hypothetical protein